MSNDNKVEKTNVAIAFITALITFLVLIPIVDEIYIPLEENKSGIISLANIKNISPYTNYIKFLTLLLAPCLTAIVVIGIRQGLENSYRGITTDIIKKVFGFFSNIKFQIFLIFVLIFLWAVNKNYSDLGWTLIDPFHEGEYLGFLPNFIKLEKPFLRSFMVHGFGLDALTSLIASKLSNHSNVIVLTRLFRMTQGLIGYLGCYWIIWELVVSCKFDLKWQRNTFFLSSVSFTVLDGIFFNFFTDVFAGRDTFFILQLALTIKFFRLANTNNLYRNEKLIVPIIIGFSLPIGFLYVYDRAAYFLLVYILTCSLSFCFGRKVATNLISRSVLGLVISLSLITILLKPDQVSEIFSQILFWILYGRYISFQLLPLFSINTFPIWSRFGFAILTQIFAILYLVSDYRKGSSLRIFLKNKFLILILLFASLTYMRISLDRPNNSNYVGSGALISMLLLIYLSLNLFNVYFKERISQLTLEPLAKYLIVIFMAFVIVLYPVLDPFLSLAKLRRLYLSYRIPDTAIVRPDFLQVSDALKSEVNRSSCFFTLNQEGLWYYLFDKPSCSKFSIIYYARTIDAQEQVIHEVGATKPNIILFGPVGYANTFEQDILASDAVPIIYRYFLDFYKPYAVVGTQWFWKRNDQKLFVTDNQTYAYQGRIDTVLDQTISKGDKVFLRGVAGSSRDRIADAVYLSSGKDNRLVEVSKVGTNTKWAVPVPVRSLPSGQNTLRVWSYSAKTEQFVQIGQDININLVA